MKIIVITGKSGSGKTYVASKLASALNAEHLKLDEISHQTLKTETLKNFVAEEFGNEVFDQTGSINRKKLGSIAFLEPEKLNKLNKLSEIEMEKIIDEKIATSNKNVIILDYMLLPKMKYFKMSQIKILVTAESSSRKARILERDGITEEYFESR